MSHLESRSLASLPAIIPVKALEEHGPYTEGKGHLAEVEEGQGMGVADQKAMQESGLRSGQSGDQGGQVFSPCSSGCLAQQGSAWGGREITASPSFLLGH